MQVGIDNMHQSSGSRAWGSERVSSPAAACRGRLGVSRLRRVAVAVRMRCVPFAFDTPHPMVFGHYQQTTADRQPASDGSQRQQQIVALVCHRRHDADHADHTGAISSRPGIQSDR